ncbi:uncharacterized protein LOC133806876 [Humulus lupulus]|uniref:uncharacterized protein LOC133806876 n=1 Tax=Humulus lupulus TaxID=3486 RepID=UPI002B41377D|nr:uncharacterized protein LOC133806876 [Humulus lupulus]
MRQPPPPTNTTENGANSSASIPPSNFPHRERPTLEYANKPYLMGNGDYLSLILASPPLTDTNFQQWARDLKILVGAKNKYGFPIWSLPQLPPDHHLFDSWNRCNQIVMSWVIHSVSPEIKSSIMFIDIAAAMWTELNNRFNQGNDPRIFEFQESLIILHQGDDSVSAYFTKLKAIWDEIHELQPHTPCTCVVVVNSLENVL